MADTIRLNKVLRELNISIDRVADFLESKGHTIEKRPTTKISKDLYSLLCDEFQIDADKKIASDAGKSKKSLSFSWGGVWCTPHMRHIG